MGNETFYEDGLKENSTQNRYSGMQIMTSKTTIGGTFWVSVI